MLRGLLSTGAAVVLTATLLWSGCVSCQPLIAPRASAQGCCDSQGKCKTPSRQDVAAKPCRYATPALDDYAPVPPDLAVEVPAAEPSLALPAVTTQPVRVVDTGPSPPELFVLNTSFRI
jgi:hypothetical protein